MALAKGFSTVEAAAEALYPIPEPLKKKCLDIITEDMRQVLVAFDQLRT